jgi:hypothetical protein
MMDFIRFLVGFTVMGGFGLAVFIAFYLTQKNKK